MKSNPIILKIGGSVITDKFTELTPKIKDIGRLAQEIQNANTDDLLLIHGGGSFGHSIAKKYALNKVFNNENQKNMFLEIHHAMTILNSLLMDKLIWHKIPAINISPSSCILTKRGRIHLFETKILTFLLEMNFFPVLYGDSVLDIKSGFAILSGDQLVSYIAENLGAKKIIMGTDVDGIFNEDPKINKDAQLFEHLTLTELKQIKNRLGGSKAIDVTGGMFGKINELIPAIEQGIPVLIVNATKPNSVYKAIKGENVKGTLIEKE